MFLLPTTDLLAHMGPPPLGEKAYIVIEWPLIPTYLNFEHDEMKRLRET